MVPDTLARVLEMLDTPPIQKIIMLFIMFRHCIEIYSVFLMEN